MQVEIRKATIADIPIIRELSETIWKRHYIEIISMQQIEYMLDKMYSVKKLEEEINHADYTYFIAFVNNELAGYIAISSSDKKNFMLHKFYILAEKRFKGIGEKVFNLVFQSFDSISLFVNRQNYKSVNFYFKMGFKIADVIDNNIGDGYFMNDFIMKKVSDEK